MMSKSSTLLLFLILITSSILSQSFEEVIFSDLSDTPSASRSANFVDVNDDGWDDVFISNGPFGGENNMLYINNADGTFTTVSNEDIVNDNDRSDGASFADADNDGDLDGFVVTYGQNGIRKKNYFYRNNGDGNFTYEPNIAMGIPLTYSEMANWIDVNNDHNLDLYFTNSLQSLENKYFENLGDGTFQSVTNLSITGEDFPSRSINWIDYDGDGDNDLFITNEEGENNSLFRNDGPDTFVQITNLEIVQDGSNSAGSSWADIDNDGDFDLFVANWANTGQSNTLYFNANGVFTEDTSSIIASPITNSFGSTFGDVDNDGDLDLFVCNSYLSSQTTNYLYINDGSGNFSLDNSSNLATYSGYTFGAAFGDYNNDGWLDILLANTLNENQNNALFKNTGTGNNWIKIRLIGTVSNHSAVGAKIRLQSTINGNETWQTRSISASSGYCSQNSLTAHFGLGDATNISEIEILWPSGLTETFTNVVINQMYNATEGEKLLMLNNPAVEFHKFVVTPNPVDSKLLLNPVSDLPYQELRFEIYNLSGALLLTTEFNPVKGKTVDLFNMSSGTYFYTIKYKNSNIDSGKLIKNSPK